MADSIFKDKTLLITGGTGSFGHTVLKHFLSTDIGEIRIFSRDEKKQDDMRHELQANHPQYAGKVKFYIGDVRNPQSIRDAMPGVNYIFHAAALKQVPSCEFFPMQAVQTNIIGTSVLMDACREYGNIRFHQVSTDEVYGDLPLDRPELLFTEQTPLHTSSPYSSSKAAADLLVGAYGRTYGLPVTISRCSNNCGPYQFPEKLIPLMIVSALADRPLPVDGRGLNVRDWLYVTDHCKAIDLVVERGRIGEVYNIGGHNEMRNIDIVRLICRKLGKPESLITYVADRQGHDLRYAIDPTKIHTELGWLPETKFADGIGRTIDWYLAHRAWWEEIVSGEYQSYYARMYGERPTPEQT